MIYIIATSSTIHIQYTDGIGGGAYLFRVTDIVIFVMGDVVVGGWVGTATSHNDITTTT